MPSPPNLAAALRAGVAPPERALRLPPAAYRDAEVQALVVEGRPRAHANSCRRRGAGLVAGCGNASGIRGPCHARLYRLDTALDDDIPALENQQTGLASPDARQGPFSPALEPNLTAFARWYAGRMLDR